jgi:hypothetical protein
MGNQSSRVVVVVVVAFVFSHLYASPGVAMLVLRERVSNVKGTM